MLIMPALHEELKEKYGSELAEKEALEIAMKRDFGSNVRFYMGHFETQDDYDKKREEVLSKPLP